MSRRYTPDDKTVILAQLRANHGNVALTCYQTGIPERTLYAWWRAERLLRQQQHTPTPPQQPVPRYAPQAGAPEIPSFDNDLEAVKFLRGQIMRELLNLSASFNEGFVVSTPYQRALVLTQLLDRLMKLDEHLKPYLPPSPDDYADMRIAYDEGYERDDLESDPFSHPSTEEP